MTRQQAYANVKRRIRHSLEKCAETGGEGVFIAPQWRVGGHLIQVYYILRDLGANSIRPNVWALDTSCPYAAAAEAPFI